MRTRSVLLFAVAGAYAYSLIGLRKKQKQAPIAVIVISIVNRVIALFIFPISEAFIFCVVWTVILVLVSTLIGELKAIH
jgi:hypothetical protein